MTNLPAENIDSRLEQVAHQIEAIRAVSDGQVITQIEKITAELADIARLHQQSLRQLESDRQVFQQEILRIWQYLAVQPKSPHKFRRRAVEKEEVPENPLEFWIEKISEDSIASWINQSVVYDIHAKTPVGINKKEGADGTHHALFGSYIKYCRESRIPPASHTKFSPQLLNLCHGVLKWNVAKIRTNTATVIHGLRLRDPEKDRHIPNCDQWLMQQTEAGAI